VKSKGISFGRVLVVVLLLTTGVAHAKPAPAPTAIASDSLPLKAGEDGRLNIGFQQTHMTLNTRPVDGAPYLSLAEKDTLNALERMGITLRWSDDKKTATLYSAGRYLRWAIDEPTGSRNGTEIAYQRVLLSGDDGAPLLRAQALADLLNFRFEPGVAEGAYVVLAVIEKIELVRDSGDRKIVLRASAPFDYRAGASGTAVRLTLQDARWGDAPRETFLEDVHVKVEGSGGADDPIVVLIQTPEQWKGEATSRFLLTEAGVRIIPSFRVASDYKGEQVNNLRAWRSGGDQYLMADVSGPVQYFWRFNPETRVLTVDVPQTSLSGPSSVPPAAEMADVQVQAMQTAAFPFVRLQTRVGKGFGFDVKLTDDAGVRLVLRFASESVLPITASTGQGYEPLGRGNGPTIVLDAGHGGSDPGAVNRRLGLRECDITLDIVLRLRDALQRRGWNVLLTRDSDRDVTYARSPDAMELGARADVANRNGAHLFVSIHCNAAHSSVHNGSSFHWYKEGDYELARALNGSLVPHGFANKGPIRNRFAVLRRTKVPALLVETAYISNTADALRLADPDTRERIAESLAEALDTHRANNAALNGLFPTGR